MILRRSCPSLQRLRGLSPTNTVGSADAGVVSSFSSAGDGVLDHRPRSFRPPELDITGPVARVSSAADGEVLPPATADLEALCRQHSFAVRVLVCSFSICAFTGTATCSYCISAQCCHLLDQAKPRKAEGRLRVLTTFRQSCSIQRGAQFIHRCRHLRIGRARIEQIRTMSIVDAQTFGSDEQCRKITCSEISPTCHCTRSP